MLEDARQRELMRHLWLEGPLSRSELHQRLGISPNAVGTVAEALLQSGVVREGSPERSRGGRPRVPLEIDPTTRHVVGLSIAPGRVEAVRLGLRGQVLGSVLAKTVEKPLALVSSAVGLLGRTLNRQTLGIGVSVTGFVDPKTQEILFSSATPGLSPVSLKTLYEEAGTLPLVLGNDAHASAARWMLSHRSAVERDVLLVGFEDGELGAAMVIRGQPNQGCVIGANELGHTRFFVATERCYCGRSGCLERICSSPFLVGNGAPAGTRLADRVCAFDGADPPLELLVRYLALGLANATNFVRPTALVLVSRLLRYPAFTDLLLRSIRGQLLVELADRVRIELWDQPVIGSSETAGWLALASLYSEHWRSTGQPDPDAPLP